MNIDTCPTRRVEKNPARLIAEQIENEGIKQKYLKNNSLHVY